jgi:hypothetical protein
VLAAKLSWRPARFLFAVIRATRYANPRGIAIGNALHIYPRRNGNWLHFAKNFRYC